MKKLLLILTAALAFTAGAFAQNRTVSGVVMDSETDEPLIGATVLPLGGGTGTATDIDGRFSISVPPTVHDIQVSYVGYITQKVKAGTDMDIKLVNNNKLQEVVVTGYGSAKKLGSVVGAVSVIGEETLDNIPTATFVDALQGQVAGLSIYSASGDPSSVDNDIRLRGVNSLNSGTTPLFILDGAPVTQSVFTTLNPSDIASITVLKDAASVAIYGSRAANGVIVITSKNGRMGERPKITIRANVGWSDRVNDKLDMMNSEQYLTFRDLIGQPASQEMKDAWYKYGINTDWLKETFDAHALTYSLEATVQGGSDNVNYYLSLNHYDANGIITMSGMRRESLRANLNARLTDWLRIGMQSNFGFTRYQTNFGSDYGYGGSLITSNPMLFARKALPTDATRYYTIDENGNIVWGDKAEFLHFSNQLTPRRSAEQMNSWRNKITANVTLYEQINPIDGLTIRAQQNVDAYDGRVNHRALPKEVIYTPMGDTYDWGGNLTGIDQQSFSRYYNFTYTNTAEYARTFKDVHDMTVLIGQESILTKAEAFGAISEGFTDSRLMMLQQGIYTDPTDLSQSESRTTANSFFARGNYEYDARYVAEVMYRRDGSSVFAPNHRWANFWGVGVKWNASNEKFMARYTWINSLQLYLNYGTTGNSSIGNYLYYGLVGPYSNPYNGGTAWGIAQPSNPDITWESVDQFDLGVNYGFMNMFYGTLDFYYKRTTDMIMAIPYSYTTGFGSGIGNVGEMKNVGFDFDLRAEIIKNRDWYWALRCNFNYNHNEITKLFDGLDELVLTDTGIKYQVGHNAGELYAVRYAGVDPRDGQQMWYDKNGNITKTFNEEEDAVLLGKSMYAPWSGGFGTDLRWKGLSLRVDFNWAAKKYMINNDRYFCENSNMATQFNQTTKMLNVWTTPGQVTDIPAADGQSVQFDSHLVEDASFMRLKNLTLTWTLPKAWISKCYLEDVTLHFTGRNLLTFTKYTGYDPEPESNVVAFFYPNTRQYEFGIDVTF